MGEAMADHYELEDPSALVEVVARMLASVPMDEVDQQRLYCCYTSTTDFIEGNFRLLRARGWAAKTGYNPCPVRQRANLSS